MNELAVRLTVVVVIVGVAALIAFVVRRVASPPHPSVNVGDVGDRPGVVLFTSTTCATCKEAIALLETMHVPFREVTNDLEAQRFETWGIVAVPVTVVVDHTDTITGTFTGVPRRGPLRRSLAAAGIETA